VSKKFGEWYQKTNKTEDTSKLTLLTFKIIAILHNTLLATFIKLLAAIQECVTAVLRSIPKEAFADSDPTLYECCQQCVVKDGDYFEGQ
jgi:transcriptional antiterminator